MNRFATVCVALVLLAAGSLIAGEVPVDQPAIGTREATTSAFPGLHKKTEIHGTGGSVIVEPDDVLLWEFEKKDRKDAAVRRKFTKRVGGTGGASDPSAISYKGHMDQLKDFIRAIETDTKPLVDGEEGRKSVEIILAIYQSSSTGKRVELPLKKDPKIPAVRGYA